MQHANTKYVYDQASCVFICDVQTRLQSCPERHFFLHPEPIIICIAKKSESIEERGLSEPNLK
jgi:hypothetical protein